MNQVIFTRPLRGALEFSRHFYGWAASGGGWQLARESFTVSPQAEGRLLGSGPEREGAGCIRCTFQLQTGRWTDALDRGDEQLPPWLGQSCSSR